MAECDNNPQTPVYSRARPIINNSCSGLGGANINNFYNPAVIGKTAEVIAGDQIDVDDLSDALVDRFQVHLDLVTQLTVELTLIAKIATVVHAIPVLSGLVVDEINSSWAYNGLSINNQGLTNDGGLVVPSLAQAARTYDHTGLTVSADVALTISGNTGGGYTPQSLASDVKSVTFGNYLAYGAAASLDGALEASAQTYFTNIIGLSQTEVRVDRLSSIYGLGGQNEKFLIFIPKVWGLASFYKNPFAFSMLRVKLANTGYLRHDLLGGETEQDIILNNGTGFTEAYYIYETFFDKMADAVTPIQIL